MSIDQTYAHTYAVVNYGKTQDDLELGCIDVTGNVPEDDDEQSGEDEPEEDDAERRYFTVVNVSNPAISARCDNDIACGAFVFSGTLFVVG